MTTSRLLFETVHGSHLYGLNHPDSDLDIYRVYADKMRSRQKINGGDDVISHSLDSFMLQASKGVPQALEAMFATNPRVDEIAELREGFRIDLGKTATTYRRTIKNFVRSYADVKRQRHGIRLTLNLNTLWSTGRFDPTLSDDEKTILMLWDGGMTSDLIEIVEHLSPVEIF